MRHVLLRHGNRDAENPGEWDATSALTSEYEKVEAWAQEISDGTSTFHSVILSVTLIFALICLGTIAVVLSDTRNENGIATVVTLSAFGFSCMTMFSVSFYGMAKVSMAWKKTEVRLLGSPQIHRAVVSLGWSDRWRKWLHDHELNASRAFGTKITMDLMRRAGGSIMTVFTVLLYFLVREQLRSTLS